MIGADSVDSLASISASMSASFCAFASSRRFRFASPHRLVAIDAVEEAKEEKEQKEEEEGPEEEGPKEEKEEEEEEGGGRGNDDIF